MSRFPAKKAFIAEVGKEIYLPSEPACALAARRGRISVHDMHALGEGFPPQRQGVSRSGRIRNPIFSI